MIILKRRVTVSIYIYTCPSPSEAYFVEGVLCLETPLATRKLSALRRGKSISSYIAKNLSLKLTLKITELSLSLFFSYTCQISSITSQMFQGFLRFNVKLIGTFKRSWNCNTIVAVFAPARLSNPFVAHKRLPTCVSIRSPRLGSPRSGSSRCRLMVSRHRLRSPPRFAHQVSTVVRHQCDAWLAQRAVHFRPTALLRARNVIKLPANCVCAAPPKKFSDKTVTFAKSRRSLPSLPLPPPSSAIRFSVNRLSDTAEYFHPRASLRSLLLFFFAIILARLLPRLS